MVRTMKNASLETASAAGIGQADPIDELPIAYVEVNAEGVITRSNRTARALHSPDAIEIAGRHAWEFAPEGHAEQDRAEFLEMIPAPAQSRRLFADRFTAMASSARTSCTAR